MGGVFGKLHFDRVDQDFPTLLARMSEALVHRGPDAVAIYVGAGIALGERAFRGERTNGGVVATNEERTLHAVVDADLTNACALRRRWPAERSSSGVRPRASSPSAASSMAASR